MKLFTLTTTTLLNTLLFSNLALAAHHHHGASAPIGVMGDHLMGKNEWMLSYRFMNMDMNGNRTGTKRVATPLAVFMVSPLKMNMNMHMMGGMYGVHDDITIMMMVPYLQTTMDHVVTMGPMAGTLFRADSTGLGDSKLSANWEHKSTGLIFNAGLSLPTGSINKTDVSPASAGASVQMPYPMQLGSGTYDALLGITKTGHTRIMNWGTQAKATVRTGDNNNGYTLGNEYNLTAWLGKSLTDSLSGTFRLHAKDWGNIDGADTRLGAAPTVPTKNTNLRGGTRLDAIVGFDATIGNNVVGLEFGIPVYQNLDGPQLETDATITLGWQAYY